jgi:hypothetical protein
MSHFDLFLYSDSPRRIYDALPPSSRKRGGKAARGLRGEFKKNTTLNSSYYLPIGQYLRMKKIRANLTTNCTNYHKLKMKISFIRVNPCNLWC